MKLFMRQCLARVLEFSDLTLVLFCTTVVIMEMCRCSFLYRMEIYLELHTVELFLSIVLILHDCNNEC